MDIIKKIIKPRWSKVLSDLWENKLRTLLVVASIAVGVFAVGTIVTTYIVLSDDIGITFAARNPANIDIRMDPFYDDLIRSIEHVPGVLGAEGRRVVDVRVSSDGKAWQTIKLIGASDYEKTNINILSSIDGSRSPGRRELVVSDDFLNSTGFQVGDEIGIELPDGSTYKLPLIGLVSDQSTNGANFMGGAIGYVTLDTMEWMGIGNYFNKMYVRVSEDSNDFDKIQIVATEVEEKIERNNHNIFWTDLQLSNEHPMGSIIFALLGIMAALGALILVLSSSLITCDRLV